MYLIQTVKLNKLNIDYFTTVCCRVILKISDGERVV